MTKYNSNTTIDTDQRENGPAIEYDGDGIEITIDTSIAVVALNNNGITCISLHSGNSLTNNGNIFSASSTGALFSGDDSSIVNNAGGSISAYGRGVGFFGDGGNFTNHGTISGLRSDGMSFGVTSNDYALNNDGDIWGRESGVNINSAHDGGVIDNSGSIRSDDDGLHIETAFGLTTEIHNEAGGLIQGGTVGIGTFFTGGIDLDNRGKVDGDIACSAPSEKDVVVNRGEIKGDVFLGSGNDKYKGKGHGTSGRVEGSFGNDKLIGSEANDTLDGGADDDLIRGGTGKDIQFGGTDSDTFDFNSIKDSVVGSKRDKIIDFQRGDDEINLKSIDAKKGSGNQEFTWIGDNNFHDKKGELRYKDKGSKVIVQGDVNGDGHADFEILVKVGELSDDDFVL
jgi:Ca2+-binding RTX toxin-like protein